MNSKTWNEIIISQIKNSLNGGENITSFLMNTLLIGRESVYRRLRSEVPFTFEEVVKIAKKMEFSIDHLIGVNNNERTVFELNMLNSDSEIAVYTNNLNAYVRLFEQMAKSSNSTARYALNTLPYSLYLPYYNLSRFKYFRWIYQVGKTSRERLSYKEIQTPSKLLEMQKSFTDTCKHVNKTVMIWDRNVFMSIKYDIEYFYQLRLINTDDVRILKEELLDMLDKWESIASAGEYSTGKEVQLYLSNVDIEVSYSLFEHDGVGCSHLRIYGIGGVESHTDKMRAIQREWINTLTRYATLISQSGEVLRYKFFSEQKQIIDNLGTDL